MTKLFECNSLNRNSGYISFACKKDRIKKNERNRVFFLCTVIHLSSLHLLTISMTATSFATDKEPQHMSLKLKFMIKVKIGLSVNFISDFSVRSAFQRVVIVMSQRATTPPAMNSEPFFQTPQQKVKHFLVVS